MLSTSTRHAVLRSALIACVALALATPSFAANTALDAPTYSRDVAPILFENCASCHRPGQGAPMTLLSFQEVRPWAKAIARNVQDGVMPPWHQTGGTGVFRNDRSLEPNEIETIVNWVKTGAPEGDAADLPAAPEWPRGEWKLGEPDLVVTFEEVEVPGGGPDQFKNLIAPTGLKEDKWVTAVEILPGNTEVAHHVITFAMKGFDVDPQGGWLGAWAAGTDPMVFPEGTGRLIKKNSNLIGDMHYHPAETPQKDTTRIGLHFADEDVAKELTNLWIMNTGFKIPAGAENHEVRASMEFFQDGKIMGFAPHMHYRGKNFTYTLTHPDGREEVLLAVDDYDFNWQTNYVLTEPIAVKEGSKIECVAHYDNSAGNPDNPDPTIDVTFGDESYDEMMIGFVDFIVDEGVRPETAHETRNRKLGELAAEHPGEVYGVYVPNPDREPESHAPLYLPREGDGLFLVIWDDQLGASKVTDLVWKGKSFEGTVHTPNGDQLGIAGKVKADGSLESTLQLPRGNSVDFVGKLAGP